MFRLKSAHELGHKLGHSQGYSFRPNVDRVSGADFFGRRMFLCFRDPCGRCSGCRYDDETAKADMTERDEKRGGSGVAIGCGLVLLLMPVLYVLSTGPVTWLVNEYPGLEFLGYLYFPLLLAAEYCKPLERAVDWYVDLWL
jgi:hypothetical protein